MSIVTERKNLNLNKGYLKQEISGWIEQDIIVPDNKPDAIKIINIHVNTFVKEIQTLDDKVKIEGKLSYYIIYKSNDTDMSTRGLNVSFPYSQTLNFKGATKNMNVFVKTSVKNVIYSLPNERKVSTKTEVIFKIKVQNPVSVSLINKFKADDNIECKLKTENFNNIIANKKNIIASKEDIMLPKENEDFFEVLKVVPTIKKTEYKESYNKIMVKGDINILFVYLPQGNDAHARSTNLDVPFTGMVELDGINEKSNYDIDYNLKDFDIRSNTEITTSKTLTADYQVEVFVKMFNREEVDYVDDFYSQTRNLKYESETLNVEKNNTINDKYIDLKDTISNILGENSRLVDYTVDTNYILPRLVGNTVHIEGNAKLNLLIGNNETRELESKNADILVNQEYTFEDLGKGSNIDVNIFTDEADVTQNGNDLDVKLKLNARIEIEDVEDINVIDNINDDRLDVSDLDSMNIYIVKGEDTLWSIAKRYKTSIEKIVRINDIEDQENIDAGQKILIIR